MFLLLLACSEYDLKPSANVPEPLGDSGLVELFAQLETDPTTIASVVCEEQLEVVMLSNVGEAELVVDAVSIDGDGWEVVQADVPLTIAVGESTDIVISGTDGTADLVIQSNDPDGELRIPLQAAADTSPWVELVEPAVDEIIAEQAAVELVALVSDGQDLPEQMQVEFSSDLTGSIGTVTPDSSGTASVLWAAENRDPGLQTVSVSVVDTCGLVEFDSAEVCQQAGYEADELDISTWSFSGTASWDGSNSWVELTPATTSQLGSAFQTATSLDGSSISIRFEFFIGNGSGADGLAMTVIDTSRMTSFLGNAGGCIGYGSHSECDGGGPGLPGWSVEVDTYQNGHDPTAQDHVAMSLDGDVANPQAWAVLPEMEDTGWHTFEADLDSGHLTVSIDGVAYIDQAVSVSSFPAYVGFTAGTGSLTNEHLIKSLSVTEYACEE
ncbi:MAG: hypothetical protein GY913_10030 [Proteobacteria bacterium]|nr:hypothetical protein [Pseudomonadota bacterium]MCP4917251.1 hypothetical protein [Pseudomonadota bacterium]